MQPRMCWMSKFGGNGELILHIQMAAHEPWKPYTAFPHISVPDYRIPGGSKGWATCQKLLKAGWKLVNSSEVSNYNVSVKDDAA